MLNKEKGTLCEGVDNTPYHHAERTYSNTLMDRHNDDNENPRNVHHKRSVNLISPSTPSKKSYVYVVLIMNIFATEQKFVEIKIMNRDEQLSLNLIFDF